MRSFFGFGSSGRLFINRNTNRIIVRKADNIQELAAMNVGGWGDPHLYIRQAQSLNPNNYTAGKFLAKWGDNKVGTEGKELLLLSIETVARVKLQVYYTNKNLSPGKAIASIRVVHNNVSTTYTNTAYVVAGPISISILKLGAGINQYLNFEMKWNRIRNIVKLGGALTVVLRRIADSGGYWNGGDGSTWDGFGVAAQPYGLTRANFETANLGILSLDNDFRIQTDPECDLQAIDITAATALSDTNMSDIINLVPQESTLLDDLNDPDTNQTVSQWDATVEGDANAGIPSSLEIFESYGTIDNYLAEIVVNGGSVSGLNSSDALSIKNNFEANNTSSYAMSAFTINFDYIP
jgi:hypothetical protein